jgi:peptidoglycan/xylan/chitin deacetylase (PgdA/CDA1 family)
MFKKIKNILKTIIFSLINFFVGLFRLDGSGYAAILMYHSVGEDKSFFTVKSEEFQWQMKYLSENNYNVLFSEELLEILKNGGQIPAKTVVITFDDGYENVYENALPILRKYKIKSNIFLISGLMGGQYTNSSNVTLKIFDWGKAFEMAGTGLVKFGCHTMSHPDLTKIGLEKAEEEIKKSKTDLEAHLNSVCKIFAYPKGHRNADVLRIIASSGFEMAVVVEEGLVNKNDKLLELKRNSVDSATSRSQFIGKLGYGIHLFNKFFR